jgi:tRNA pseudouridine38-40 synthase
LTTTVRLVLEYDGSEFSGWAAQEGLRTVESVLSDAIETVLREEVKLSVAGRTDAGVHAWGQVASFGSTGEPEPDSLLRSLNGVLPPDVVVQGVEHATDGFDARKDARSRTYCYRVLARPARSPFERGRSLWWPRPLDEEVLAECAGRLVGTHDFTAFTPTETEHVRFERDVMRAEWRREGDLLEFWIEADTFMRHMVGILVGTMLEVAAGRQGGDDFRRLLAGASRPEAGPTAEPHGLYLASVRYEAHD